MGRYVVHLVHESERSEWLLRWNQVSLGFFPTKRAAIQAGKVECLQVRGSGTQSQLIVHRDDGSVESEHTYV